MVEGDINSVEEEHNKSKTIDRWLLETTYKNSVRLLLARWRTRVYGMRSLYDEILALDAWRRNKLQENLLTFLPRRRRLFLRIQQTIEPGIDSMETGRLDLTQADEQLEDTVARLSRQRISKNNMHRSNIMNRSRSKQPVLDERFAEDKQELTVEVLDSPHIDKYEVVQAKLPTSGDWQLGVLVCTVDKTMHLFVLPKGGENGLSLSSPASEIMRALPTDSLSPALSTSLTTSRFKLSMNLSHVDVTPDMSKLPVSLRMRSSKDVIKWHDSYNKPKVVDMLST
jgi:hypothetical protein